MVPYDASASNTTANDVIDDVLAATSDGHIDRMILNAGIYQLAPALMTPVEYSRRVMLVNYQSPTELAVNLLQRETIRPPQQIVVVASVLSRGSFALVSSYAASKHALRAFFHSLAAELKGTTRIDVACPAATTTNLWEGVLDGRVLEENVIADLMPADRVAWLILTGATGPYMLFWETWIGKWSPLFWTAATSYPSMFQGMNLFFGRLRMRLYEKDGADVSDPFALLGAYFDF